LIDLILVKDPKFERSVDIVAEKLALILQKPEQEMKMMLKRTHFQNRKKAQKLEVDKLQSALIKTVEICLKESNKIDSLSNLKQNFSLKLSKDNRDAFAKVAQEVKEFVKLSNEYYKYKSLEEKARVSDLYN